jgi:nucleotide-binding universal stress UspA family protein
MYRRILVPVDGSPVARRAVAKAVEIAREQGKGSVRLVHVVDEAPLPWGETEFMRHAEVRRAVRRAGERVLQREARKVKAAHVGVETSLLVRSNYPERIGDLISDQARRSRAELIVMGSHGRGTMGRLFIGSVAQAVVRGAQADVLLVRAGRKARG